MIWCSSWTGTQFDSRAGPSSLQAQENILEINKGRVRALEELKVAKKRIADLGACCVYLGQDIVGAYLGLPAWAG